MAFGAISMAKRVCIVGLLLAGGVSAAWSAEEVKSPLAPADALKQFQLDPGLAIELVACEPEVIDPVAIRFDEDGRLWVVEMRDYPHGPAEGQPPVSTIRVLDDRDGDGRYETSKLFAEHLLFPTGLQPWQGGLIVTLAGQVVYLKDTDGDGRADLREVWYQGFEAENPQLRANHPRFGIDNRVYVANGLRGGTVSDPRRPEQKPLSISGRDFSFDPRSGDCEAVSGNGQFGNAFDDFGNRFVCNNRVPLDHVVLENRYLARNPFLAVPSVLANVAAQGDASRVYPLTQAWTTSNLHAGQFTAACGVEIFRGDALGPEYVGNALVCEPTGSLVHREIVKPDGVTFTAKAASEGREFLASRDSWFRPVNLETGPDGALYVVDMYRAVIEHPQYMPVELQTRPDLHLGNDRGRIYRIRKAGNAESRPRPELSKASSAQIVASLGDKNSWYRETAARLLYERQDGAAVQPLESLASGKSPAYARVAALRALDGMNQLSDAVLLAALKDGEPRVREQAVVLAEKRLSQSSEVLKAVLSLADDKDARVAFRTALAIGDIDSSDATASRLRLVINWPADRWIQTAVASAQPGACYTLLESLLAHLGTNKLAFDAPEVATLRELATIVGSRQDAGEIGGALLNLPPGVVGEQVAVGVGRGLGRRGGSLATFVAKLPDSGSKSSKSLEAIFKSAAKRAAADDLSDDERAQAIELLQYDPSESTQVLLTNLVIGSPSQALRAKAAASLTLSTREAAEQLLESYPTQSPQVRRAILDAMLVRGQPAFVLLEAVETKEIARIELEAAREDRLRKHADVLVRSLAAKLLTKAMPAERKKVLADYQNCLELEADARAGRELFRQHCSTCHRIGDLGVNVAPDISDSRVKTPAQLLTDILNPNQAIDNNYVSYTVVTTGGQSHVGVIGTETANSLVLRQAEDKSVTLLRSEIEAIRSNGVSLMPEGFEKTLSRQQVADVISFVKNWRYLDPASGTTIAVPAR